MMIGQTVAVIAARDYTVDPQTASATKIMPVDNVCDAAQPATMLATAQSLA